MNDGLRQVLRTIERSILPRIIHLRTANGQLQIEVSAQRMQLCPRRDGAFFLGGALQREAPEAWEVLRGGERAVRANTETLAAARGALLRHCARALADLTAGAATVEHIVKPAGRAPGGPQPPSFDVRELLAALTAVPAAAASPLPDFRRQAVNNGKDASVNKAAPAPQTETVTVPPEGRHVTGLVEAFYRQLTTALPDTWLFDLSGQPAGSPARARQQDDINGMAKTVAPAREWREFLGGPEGPVMAIFFEPAQEGLRCLAIDGGHVALLSGTGMELGPILTAWRAAQQNAGKP
jgi:hypothetical protein